MHVLPARLRACLAPRAFYRETLAVMLPIIVQQLINTLFNVVDQIMVGSLGELAISAVNVANKPFLIYNGIIFGISGAGGILLSQYYGANDYRRCQTVFAMEMAVVSASAVAFCTLLLALPGQIMGIFVRDATTTRLGVEYLSLVCFSYIPTAVSSTCVFALRSLGKNRMPMLVSLVAMALNALFNYAFIFGALGAPALGVRGAALGTLCARLCEMGVYLFVLARRRAFFSLDFSGALRPGRALVKSFARRALPLTGNELLWTLGLNVYFWCYARLDEAALPALTIADQIMQIGVLISVGMSSAVAVLVGTQLGAGDFAAARLNCKRLLLLAVMISLGSSAITVICAFAAPQLFPISQSLRALATRLSLIYAIFCLPNAVYAFCFYCLRAGGDTRNAALLDSGYMWLVPVPASVLMAIFLPGRIALTAAVLIIQTLMNAKVVLALRILKKGDWVRNITAEA